MLVKKSLVIFIFLPIFTIIAHASNVSAETIETANFQIKITRHCEEGNVSCGRVTYVGKNSTTGKSIRLNGKTINSSYSYRFLGYEFRNGKYTYYIDNNNLLQVYRGRELILQEQGTAITSGRLRQR
ncbi:hypothetical protein [Chamaesiphon sp. VAR_48_metabat_403]|uniref:hypothetical protein n=1 Tax=Chamaesiphon sp. VAR_48_metabat_403 TaxID=2964700 RepID=UPI00286E9DB9|nr:hypothetical protein [Chamaesiphon sp. VAR_48_metabat_403]